MNSRSSAGLRLGTLVLLCIGVSTHLAMAADRPNIVWILSEDTSKHYFRHFDPDGVETPNIQAMAKDGVSFDHAFSCAPVCSVARTTLLTGCYGPRIGTQFHRAISPAAIPTGLELAPTRLRSAGYYTTNNSKTDYNVVLDQDAWDASSAKATWRGRPDKSMPFFHVQTLKASHESSLHFNESEFKKQRSTAQDVSVPRYLPDTPLVRFTKQRYGDRIRTIDDEVGQLVEQLRSDGLLEDTFIFFFGDHGGVLPRSKGYLFETGLHVPLVVRVPENFQSLSPFSRGGRTDGFVEFVDFPATVLTLAGLSPSKVADGKSFMGKGVDAKEVESRNVAFGYADRFDEKSEMVRSLRVDNFKYIRSFEPFIPDALHNDYRYKMLAYAQWRKLFQAGKLNPVQAAFFLPKEAERLYDLSSDPDELNNLAGNDQYRETLLDLRQRLTSQMKAMPDLSLYPESMLIDNAIASPVDFGDAHRDAIGELIDIADLVFAKDDPATQTKLTAALQSDDPWKRYRAAIVCASLKSLAMDTHNALSGAIVDPEPLVAVRAAQALAIVSGIDHRKAVLAALVRARQPAEALEVLNCIVQINERPQSSYRFSAQSVADSMAVKEKGEIERRMQFLRDEFSE